jgi:small subunit ribosomal protein S8
MSDKKSFVCVNDVLSDTLARISNAQKRKFSSVFVIKSNLVTSVLKVLEREGYVDSFSEGDRLTEVTLKYFEGRSVISEVKRISKPGRRIYAKTDELKKVYNGLGISIISTSKGVFSDQEARKERLGGEVLCSIY